MPTRRHRQLHGFLLADARPDRDDLFLPAQLMRDTDGVTTGCRARARGTATR